MNKILIIALLFLVNQTIAQSNLNKKFAERKGFVIGLGVGAGTLALNTNDTTNLTFSGSLPNIKIGYMINSELALLAMLPGATYKYKGNDRGFEGITLAAQYWFKNNWSVLGGAGLTFDAPAFYTVKDIQSADFHIGFPSVMAGIGYEVWRKGRFALDLQYRIFIGKSDLENNGHRRGVSNMLIIGFNWY